MPPTPYYKETLFGSLVLWFFDSLVLWFFGSLVLWFIGSLGRWFVGSLVLWFFGSLRKNLREFCQGSTELHKLSEMRRWLDA